MTLDVSSTFPLLQRSVLSLQRAFLRVQATVFGAVSIQSQEGVTYVLLQLNIFRQHQQGRRQPPYIEPRINACSAIYHVSLPCSQVLPIDLSLIFYLSVNAVMPGYTISMLPMLELLY